LPEGLVAQLVEQDYSPLPPFAQLRIDSSTVAALD
jgi:hypothetical protein